jgi:hypothetical protein
MSMGMNDDGQTNVCGWMSMGMNDDGQTNVCGWMSMDGHLWTEGDGWTETAKHTDVDRHWMQLGWTSDRIATDVK